MTNFEVCIANLGNRLAIRLGSEFGSDGFCIKPSMSIAMLYSPHPTNSLPSLFLLSKILINIFFAISAVHLDIHSSRN